jgi:hypothetical protein
MVKEYVSDAMKFIKYLKDMMLDMSNVYPDHKSKLNKLLMTNVNGFITELETVRTKKEMAKTNVAQYIANTTQFMIFAEFRDTSDKITVDSINEGLLEIHVDKIMHFPIGTDLDFTALWKTASRKTKHALSIYLHALYLYGNSVLNAFISTELRQHVVNSFEQLDLSMSGQATKAKEYINTIVITEDSNDAQDVRQSTGNLVDDIVGVLTSHGIDTDSNNMDYSDFILKGDFESIFQSAQDKVKQRIMSGEININKFGKIFESFEKTIGDNDDDISKVLKQMNFSEMFGPPPSTKTKKKRRKKKPRHRNTK